VQNNSSPVDLDLLNDTLRLPYRQRLSILLNEFGTGLAGRGDQLNTVIHRANPALKETDAVLALLAKQNKTLERLATNSDRALGPIARERRHVSDFIVQANATGQASAERSTDIARGIERLPSFLQQLRPLMVDLDSLARQGTPVLDDLGQAAPQMGRLIKGLGTFSEEANKSFPSLGNALERGRPALIQARPLIRKLSALGEQAKPAVADLDKLTASLKQTNGIQRINDFLYYLTLATNGYDSLGHYLRAGSVISATCSNYALAPASSTDCYAFFYDNDSNGSSPQAAAATADSAPSAKPGTGGSVAPQGSLLQNLIGTPDTKALEQQRQKSLDKLRQRSRGGSSALGDSEPVLDYLLGGER
jgi:ABC-type transporter Mla subunit MlaD